MKDFTYRMPMTVYFSEDTNVIEKDLAAAGDNILLAYGGGSIKKNGIYDELMSLLTRLNKNVYEFSGIMPNPTYAKVQEGAALCKEHQIDFILAVGGGSVFDCVKIVSLQAKCEEDIWEMQARKEYTTNGIPFGAVLTVSGTGSEMNNIAIITNEEKHIKGPLAGSFAQFALLNVNYTLSVPMHQVISGAFDTFSHAMETYFGKNKNVSDDIALAIMKNTVENMLKLKEDPMNKDVRSDLMWDSAMAENGILKLGKVTDFQIHQIEHQLGAYTDCNHGYGLAVITPHFYEHLYLYNIAAFVKYGKEVWGLDGKDLEVAEKSVTALASFIKDMGLPTTFKEMNITDKSILRKVADTCNIMPGCAKQFSRDELYDILLECL
jgi:alcohol dehydrogenase YqhD (iron-dependent ADH family)